MTLLTFIIFGVIIILMVLVWVAKREAKRHGTKVSEEFTGICSIVFDRTIKKQVNLKKIMDLFEKDKELTNQKIRKALGVSSKTAVNYMDELERQGKVKQVGKIGHSVSYQIK